MCRTNQYSERQKKYKDRSTFQAAASEGATCDCALEIQFYCLSISIIVYILIIHQQMFLEILEILWQRNKVYLLSNL